MQASSPATITTGQRGRIMTYQASGLGTVSMDGVQYPFDVSKHWRSDTAPALNAVVDVCLDASGAIETLHAVSTQQLAQEDMAIAAKLARAKGQQLWSKAVAMLGLPVLASIGVLLAGAFLFNVLDMRLYGNSSFSFWEMLGMPIDNLERLSQGTRSSFTSGRFFFLLAISACCASLFIHNAKAALGKAAPLLFLLIYSARLTMTIRDSVNASTAGVQSLLGGRNNEIASRMADEMLSQVWHSMSFGVGAYLLLASATVLAAYGYGEYKRKTIG